MLLDEDDAVLFLLENGKGIVGVGGSDDDLEENLADFLCGVGLDGAVGDNDAPECADGVAGEGVGPGLGDGSACCEAAGVVVLEDCHCGLFAELGDESAGGVDVKKVVIGNFLSVELVEHLVELTEESTGLMGVFAVAEVHLTVDSHTERAGRGSLLGSRGCEPVEDGGVVSGADGECRLGHEAALGEGSLRAGGVEDSLEVCVLVLRGDDEGVVEVLGGGADEGDAAYVDFLDDVFGSGAGSGNCGFKG